MIKSVRSGNLLLLGNQAERLVAATKAFAETSEGKAVTARGAAARRQTKGLLLSIIKKEKR